MKFKLLTGLLVTPAIIPLGINFSQTTNSNNNKNLNKTSNDITWDVDNNGLIKPHDKTQVEGDIVIPAKVGEKVVKGILGGTFGASAFSGCKNLRSVSFEENTSFTTIGIEAFYTCTSLVSVTLPGTITSIGDRAFWDCSLETINFENNDHYVWKGNNTNGYLIAKNQTDQYACPSCLAIGTIDLTGATVINREAFDHCTGVTKINIPNTVTSIGEGAFYQCTPLTSIFIPHSVTSLGIRCFAHNDNLTDFITEWTKEEVDKLDIKTTIFQGCNSINIHYTVHEGENEAELKTAYETKFTQTGAQELNFINDEEKASLLGLIIGSIFGSIAVIGLLTALIFVLKRKRDNKRTRQKY
ncbi:MAG: leucine-rich repeat domain-containing protein [Mycoplasma sp.]